MTIVYNGYQPGETRVNKRRPRKADAGHTIVEYRTTRLGSTFTIRTRIVCQCGWAASTKADNGSLWSRHNRHVVHALDNA